MNLPPAFWDSSALIPLCADQPQTSSAKALYNCYSIVVWWATEVEIVSGLTRLERMGGIDNAQFLVGKGLMQSLQRIWTPVHESPAIASKACALLEKFPLRAADALQLAAALQWCEGQPNGNVFLTFDRRLREAAGLAGFTLE
jgi:predicted nucleic acid-binding protein